MQIIAGVAAGMALSVPPGLTVRPTPDRARKALFDSLGDCCGLTVYDLFAGSGAMGLEAASRGAARVAFLESSPQHGRYLNDNIVQAVRHGVKAELRLLPTDVMKPAHWCVRASPDWVFADPPYAVSGEAYRVLFRNRIFLEWLGMGRVIWELPSGEYSCQEFAVLPEGYCRCYRRFGNITFMMIDAVGSPGVPRKNEKKEQKERFLI